jgi:uncharacterized membrane protein
MVNPVNQQQMHGQASRFQFVDLLRGWAVLIMIETHVVNALLLPDLKKQTFFTILSFVNGLVAPSFLFCAGFALAIALHRKWDDFIFLRRPFWRYLIRLGFILIVGYSLHLPFFSFSKLQSITDPALWITFYQSDILQAISVTLFAMVLFAVLLRNRKLFLAGAGAIALLLIYTAPVVRDLDYSSMALWLRPFFTARYKSQFPLFPWSAFLIGGVIIGFWFLQARQEKSERRFISNITILGVAAVVLSVIAEIVPVSIYPYHKFWRASPEFFFVRFGLVILFLVSLWWYEQKKTVRGTSIFSLFGQESLLVYVVHLSIVYGYTYKWSFVSFYGQTLQYTECLGLFIVLSMVMMGLAFGWNLLRRKSPVALIVIRTVVFGGIILQFFFSAG